MVHSGSVFHAGSIGVVCLVVSFVFVSQIFDRMFSIFVFQVSSLPVGGGGELSIYYTIVIGSRSVFSPDSNGVIRFLLGFRLGFQNSR